MAKIYHPGKAPSAEKIYWLMEGATDALVQMAAWPLDTLHEHHGGPLVGYLMPKVVGGSTLDQLYDPGDRFRHFPAADWRFLTTAAINCAVVFEHVHWAGFLVGDVKQDNVLVRKDAGVVLVDCDSFQVRMPDGRVLRCGVGVDEFTPPELQGQNPRDFDRVENHDLFGLAVLIFRLLLVGRHPFSGAQVKGKTLNLVEAIRQKQFVYTRRSGGSPLPPDIPTLDILPFTLAKLFEQAFAPDSDTAGRPTAAEWRAALTEFQAKLQPCKADRLHYYHPVSTGCPWCRFEKKYQAVYFKDPLVKPATPKVKSKPKDRPYLRLLVLSLIYGIGVPLFVWTGWRVLEPVLRSYPEEPPQRTTFSTKSPPYYSPALRELDAIRDRAAFRGQDREAIPELIMATTRQEEAVRAYARRLLVKIDPGWESSPEARRCYGRLIDIVRTHPLDVPRFEACKRLDSIDKGWRKRWSQFYGSSPDEPTSRSEWEAMAISDQKGAAIRELDALLREGHSAIPKLIVATTDREEEVRNHALQLLTRIYDGWETSLEARQCYGQLLDIVRTRLPTDVTRIEACKRLDSIDKDWREKWSRIYKL